MIKQRCYKKALQYVLITIGVGESEAALKGLMWQAPALPHEYIYKTPTGLQALYGLTSRL